MALALYDPARFDRSPASTFSLSHQTVAADLRLMNIENQVSVLDLRGAMRRKSERHRACFASVLDRCYSRIRRCASVLRDECTFEVPLFVPGLPVYDVEKCVRFVASHLAKNGFRVERMPAAESENEKEEEGRMLVISWSTHDPSDDPPPPPLAYRPMPKILPPPSHPSMQQGHEQPAWNPRQATFNGGTVEKKPMRTDTSYRGSSFGSAFAPLISPERLMQPASDFSPPPPQFASLSPPMAVGTRIPSTNTHTEKVHQDSKNNKVVSAPHSSFVASKKDDERTGPSRSINEFKPSRKFALR